MPKGIYTRNPESEIYKSKLSSVQDKTVAELYEKGDSQKEVAKKFDCSCKCIRASLKRTGTSTKGRRGRSGARNGAWKGGRIQCPDGYISLHFPEHPMANGQGYVLEHRLVMSQLLGRLLKRKEVVHHKNGIHSDNSPQNLLLFANNGVHLGVELLDKCPQWTQEGISRIASRSIPSMKGIHQTTKGTGVRTLRRKLIQKFLHETSELQNTGLEAGLTLPPSYS